LTNRGETLEKDKRTGAEETTKKGRVQETHTKVKALKSR
jgi:hypothetical protein